MSGHQYRPVIYLWYIAYAQKACNVLTTMKCLNVDILDIVCDRYNASVQYLHLCITNDTGWLENVMISFKMKRSCIEVNSGLVLNMYRYNIDT